MGSKICVCINNPGNFRNPLGNYINDTHAIVSNFLLSKENGNTHNLSTQEQSYSQLTHPQTKVQNDMLEQEFTAELMKYAEEITEEQFKSKAHDIVKSIENYLGPFDNFGETNITYFNVNKPPLLLKNSKTYYKGSWSLNGAKEGQGELIDAEGNKYMGNFSNDKFHGKGRLINIKGDYFQGHWKEGNLTEGKLYVASQNITYTGRFKNNLPNDKEGKMFYNNTKCEYVGGFKKGIKEGIGTFVFPDGSKYSGNFKDNTYNGSGEFTFADGRIYKGEFKNGEFDGKGEFIWPNKATYHGEYVNGVKEGPGIYKFGKNYYDGYFKNGIANGNAKVFIQGQTKKVLFGEFKDGVLVRVLNAKEFLKNARTINIYDDMSGSEKSNEKSIDKLSEDKKTNKVSTEDLKTLKNSNSSMKVPILCETNIILPKEITQLSVIEKEDPKGRKNYRHSTIVSSFKGKIKGLLSQRANMTNDDIFIVKNENK